MMCVHTKIHESGRVLIPAHFRRALDLKADDALMIHIKNDEIVLTPVPVSLKKAQDIVATYNLDNVSLTEKLVALRQEEQ